MWFDFFINKNIWNKLKIRKEIDQNFVDNNVLDILYKNKYKKYFKNWFIPKINRFLTKEFKNFSTKIDLEFFKNNSINLNNLFYKRLFILIFDNKHLLKEQINEIIFKILYLYDRGVLIIKKIEDFYHQDYLIFKSNKNVKNKFIFETNKNEKLKLQKAFLDNLKQLKLDNLPIIKYEHLSCKDRNEIILNSYKGFYLFKIIINYLKLDDKLKHKNRYELKLDKIIITKQNKYLDEKYNFTLIYSFFWTVYKNYDFAKISELIYIIFTKDKNYKKDKFWYETYDVEFKDIFMVRNKLKLNEYPKLLTRLNFGKHSKETKNEVSQNFNIIYDLIKPILDNSIKINEIYTINHIYFWIKNDYEWLLFYNNEFKKDPLRFFQKLNKELENWNFGKSSNYYEKKKYIDEILSIYNEIHGKLETITNYMYRKDKKIKMSKLIDNLNISYEEKNKLKDWWMMRGQYFAHNENFEKEFWLKEIWELKKIEKDMKEYKLILNKLNKKIQ